MSDDFQFKQAVRRNTHLLISIAAPSGGGKTWSLLELAMGLTENGRIAIIDTEANRSLHYADFFSFDQMDFRPPFTPARYSDAIMAAERAGYDVIIVDSMSLEHSGEGGLLEMAEAELRKPNMKSPANWAAPKAQHKKMMGHLLQCRAHLLFSLRAEERIKIVKVPDGRGGERTAVESAGFVPIQEKNFSFEMTASFLMTPDRPGVPQPIKLQSQHIPFFPPDRPITRDAGRALAAWAAGAPVPSPQDPVDDALTDTANKVADQGSHAFRLWWRTLIKGDRDQLRLQLARLQMRAVEADESASADTPPSGAGAVASLGTVPASSISAPVREAPETGREGPILAGRTPPPVDEPVADAAEDVLTGERLGDGSISTVAHSKSSDTLPGIGDDLRHRLTEAASKGVTRFDRFWVHVLTPEERAIAAPMCGQYREIAMKAEG